MTLTPPRHTIQSVPSIPSRTGAQLPFQPASAPHVPMVFDPPTSHPQWEYHVVAIDPREDEPLAEAPLAALGADGWLLAGILPTPGGTASGRIYYYFVRAAL